MFFFFISLNLNSVCGSENECKDSANRAKYKIKVDIYFHLRGAACFRPRARARPKGQAPPFAQRKQGAPPSAAQGKETDYAHNQTTSCAWLNPAMRMGRLIAIHYIIYIHASGAGNGEEGRLRTRSGPALPQGGDFRIGRKKIPPRPQRLAYICGIMT